MQDALHYIQSCIEVKPRAGVILGSGLGGFAAELAGAVSLPFTDIPGWPKSTAVGHAGRFSVGMCAGVPTAVMAGRAHLYEGYTPAQVTFGVRVLRQLGVKALVVTNAAGGIGANLGPGDLVLISDHINLQGSNPLIGPNDDDAGPRFPDMTEAYSRRYREIAKAAASENGIALSEGVYVAVTGPSYETPAEIRYLRTIGADLVGMSTVPEVTVANYLGMKVLGISVVTNLAAGLSDKKLSHEEVLATGERVKGTLVQLLQAVLPRLEI